MKTKMILALFSFWTVSFADECGEYRGVQIPPFGTLEYFRFMPGMSYKVTGVSDVKPRRVKLSVFDFERGSPLEIIHAEGFKKDFEATKTVKIKITELPSKKPDELIIRVQFTGFKDWGIQTFQFDIDRTVKILKKEDLPKKKKKPLPSLMQMLTTTPPSAGFIFSKLLKENPRANCLP